MLESAAKSKASETMGLCSKTRDECMQENRDRLTMVMGKAPGSKVSNKDAEVFLRQGATAEVKNSMTACVAAKKENPQASCEDPYTKFKDTTKRQKPTPAKAQKPTSAKLMVDSVKDLAKSHREVCFEQADKS